MRRLHVIALLVLLIAAGGCRERALSRSGGKPPVIIISIDTLRSDRLPAYGYKGVETPALDALRADSVLFERAYTHCPLTLPAHASLFTGRYPADHGARDNVGYQVNATLPTISSLLKTAGYTTGGAVSSFVLRKETGIGRGFDFWDDMIHARQIDQVIGRIQRSGKETAGIASRWLGEQGGKPAFVFLHIYEPHTPYDPPEPFKSRYASSPYDGEIAHSDQIVGEFIDSLKSSGVYDDALIILLSDHGEGLGEHREDEHGIFLYREAIQIPLIMKLPGSGKKGTSVATPVQLIDILPTVAQQADVSIDAAKYPGRSLVDSIDIDDARIIYSESYYPRFHFGWSDLHSATDGKSHLISSPKPELFDLVSDPGETRNTLNENRRTYAALRKALEPLVREAAAPAAINAEDAAKLAALGYLGAGVQTGKDEALPDPKDKIDSFRNVRVAYTHFKKRDYVSALRLSEELLKENPRMLDVWDLKARVLGKLGRPVEAIAAAKEGLRLAPTASYLAILIANFALEANRLDEAQQHAELVVGTDKAQAHELLARIFLARGNLARAEEEAKKALASDGDRVLAYMALGRVERERDNFAAALGHFDQAAKTLAANERPSLANLNFLRGDALARLGRVAEAEAAFRKEIEVFPSEPHAYKNLILLYVTEGRTDEATRLVFDLIRESPTPPSYIAIVETLRTVGDERGARYWTRKAFERFPEDANLRRVLRS